MDSNFIYLFNLKNSLEFASLDALYHVLERKQEEKWDIWWEYAKTLSSKESVFLFKTLESFIKNKSLRFSFQPSIKKSGEIYDNKQTVCSFIVSYHSGDKNFFNIV